ncbi:MAG TPA: hypothetical protein VIO64_07815 [Pseudobacteroides sp.]|uniref:hypothetical protein n=1 Tax=Pseudobacteroides sp. TaxID=1968840 RepID=UPI002F95EAEC
MTGRIKIVKITLLITMFFASFYLFTGTSWFDALNKASGSYMYSVIFINIGVLGALILTVFAGVKPEKIIYIVSILLCFPSVLYHSKLNWFTIIWGLKVSDRSSFALTALISVYVILGIFLVARMLQFERQCEDWVASGAEYAAAADVYKSRLEVLFFAGGFTAIPLFGISIFGSIIRLPSYMAMGSVVLAVLGVLPAAFIVFYFTNPGKNRKE